MKVISYSLFKSDCQEFERAAYIRGFVFNLRMNILIYPSWITHLEVDRATYDDYKDLIDWLVCGMPIRGISLNINEEKPDLCRGMLYRMKPIFNQDVTHVLCRDADALTTYREALCVQEWLESGLGVHAILDNTAHGGLMGGMVGFDTSYIKSVMGWDNWEQVVAGYDLSQRGSDQHLMNQNIYPKVAGSLFTHRLNGQALPGGMERNSPPAFQLPEVNPNLWTSNLCVAFIGAAGVNEMETIRWFKANDEYDYKYNEIMPKYPQIFYWK